MTRWLQPKVSTETEEMRYLSEETNQQPVNLLKPVPRTDSDADACWCEFRFDFRVVWCVWRPERSGRKEQALSEAFSGELLLCVLNLPRNTEH